MVTTPRARHPFGGPWARFGPVGLLLVVAAGFFGLGLHEAWLDSPTFDEPVYVSAGLAAVLHHDATYNDEHPLLPKVVAVLPVLLTHPVVPANGHWDTNDERTYSATFLDAQRRAGLLRSVTLASRVIPLLEAAGLAFVLYALGRDLFGRAAGTLAGLLWLLSPFVLGLGHLESLDVSFALATALWSWVLLRWLRGPTTRRTVVLGLATGAAVLTDVTGLILVAIAAIAVLGAGWRGSRRRALRQCALVLLETWASVWVLYAAFDPRVLLDLTVIAPAPYLHGIAYLARNDTVGAPGYLFGAAWTGGRWWYWPGALVAKTVPTTLLVLVAGPVVWRTLERTTRRQAALVLAAPGLCLVAFTVLTPRDIGVRYLLPVLALWLVAASPIVGVARRSAAGEWLLAGVVVISGVALVLSSPDSLSWVAPPFAPAYRSLTNSDVDWGQGLYRLADWSAGKDPHVAYFGPRGLAPEPIAGARPLLGTDPGRVRGWVAVSATDLTSQDFSQLAWLRAYCPVGQLGGSILLYRFERPPSSAPGPARPAGLCAAGGAVSVRVAPVTAARS
jgi:dolichyl-phosphate-mannose-protein mannosyltransferase